MSKEDLNFNLLPEIVQTALKSPSLELSTNLIGQILRNNAELNDLQQLVAKMRDPNQLAIGIVGSRTEGRLTYSPEQLAKKLYYEYQQGKTLGITESQSWLSWDQISSSIIPLVKPLAEWLTSQAEEKNSLSEINLEELPDSLKHLVKIPPMIKLIVFPKVPRGDIEIPRFPLPGAFFPDIDIWTVSLGNSWFSIFDDTKSNIVVGPQSGTLIQVHHLLTQYGQKDEDLWQAEKALGQFKPILFKD